MSEMIEKAMSDQEIKRLKSICVRLWLLLDNIDTLDDFAKGDDPFYRQRSYEIQRERFKVLSGEEWDRLFNEIFPSRKGELFWDVSKL